MLARVVVVTFLLGIATFVELKGMQNISEISASTLFKTIFLTYLLSIAYLLLLKHIPNLVFNIYVQSLCDTLLVTGMVYATGGIHSLYSVFYPLVIIYSVLFLGRRGGLIIASTSSIFYGLFVDLEFYGVIYPIFATSMRGALPSAAYVFMRIIAHIISFYIIALLTSFVVEQEKKARALLAEKQSAFVQLDLLYRSIIESVDTGILTIDMSGQIKSFNRAASEITRLPFRAVENRTITDVFADFPLLANDQNPNGHRQTTRTRFETTFYTKDGRNLLLGGSISPLRDPQGLKIGNIVVFQDLTEINAMRESLEKSQRLAFIGEMAAGLAHEIRNPLASISGSIQMLGKDLSHNETHKRLITIILRGKDQLESFLKDFLLLARPAPGLRDQIDLNEIIRDVIDSLRFVPDWTDCLKLDLRLEDDPLIVLMNRTECRQILWNVTLNAIQSMPKGGTLTVETCSCHKDDKDFVEIRICDTGMGIEKSKIQKIYEPFFTTRDMGTGLGLAVVNRILEGYQGKIDIQSDPGKGTACTIWIPFRIPPLLEKRISSKSNGG